MLKFRFENCKVSKQQEFEKNCINQNKDSQVLPSVFTVLCHIKKVGDDTIILYDMVFALIFVLIKCRKCIPYFVDNKKGGALLSGNRKKYRIHLLQKH